MSFSFRVKFNYLMSKSYFFIWNYFFFLSIESLGKSQGASKPKPNPNFDSADPDYAMWLPPTGKLVIFFFRYLPKIKLVIIILFLPDIIRI